MQLTKLSVKSRCDIGRCIIDFNNVVPGTNAINIAPAKTRIMIHIFGFSFFLPNQ